MTLSKLLHISELRVCPCEVGVTLTMEWPGCTRLVLGDVRWEGETQREVSSLRFLQSKLHGGPGQQVSLSFEGRALCWPARWQCQYMGTLTNWEKPTGNFRQVAG